MQELKPYKKKFEHSYSLGIFPTLELLTAQPNSVSAVILSSKSGVSPSIDRIKKLCQTHAIPCQEDDKTIARLSKNDNCYAVGVFKKHEPPLTTAASHVVLAQPSDMGNLGTIARTMLGFGYKDLAIIKPGSDIFDPKSIRASMGAIFKLRISYFDSLESYISAYPRQLYLFSLDAEGSLSDCSFASPHGLVFGNEGSGLPKEYLQLGQTLRIEQTENIDSFNLSIAVGIALYTASRQSSKNAA